MDNRKRYGAELVGTFLLVFLGVGSAIAARIEGGVVVVALAFGLTLLVLTYVLAPVSNCHVNPAVTLGALVSGRIGAADAIRYWVAQVAGAVLASFLLWVLARWGGVEDQTGVLGTNGYGDTIDVGGAILLQTVLTFFLVLVVLVVTSRTEYAGFAGIAVGTAFAACQLVGVALDGGAVNPARSIGPAVFEGGAALAQLWVFVLFPLLGGLLAGLALPLALGGSGHAARERAAREAPPPGAAGRP
ncbi:MAG TPA: aquaporin [Micromonosporaceae bacterium]|nr:aquaporin [Micromonosporaceae bacterium]